MVDRTNINNIVFFTFYSFITITILNVILHWAFPQIEILKTGFAFVLICISILIVMMFSIAYDRKIDKIEIWFFLIILAVLVGAFFVMKKYIPELFSILNNASGGAFSFISP